jgi:hypothetical protein
MRVHERTYLRLESVVIGVEEEVQHPLQLLQLPLARRLALHLPRPLVPLLQLELPP